MKEIKFLIVIGILMLISCEEQPKEWVYKEDIMLEGISPIGMLATGADLWLSDVDNNRLVKIKMTGKILQEIKGLIRPMHIDGDGESIYIPQFGADNIVRWNKDGTGFSTISIGDSLDAPGAVSLGPGMIAVADFFNHRVLVNAQEKFFVIGKEGHDNSSLYYPTDIEITDQKIYIADAYNNRVQIYDLQGNYSHTIGWQEGIKVASGVEVSDKHVFITDFHGSRLLIYDLTGKLLQIFTEHLISRSLRSI